MKYAIFENGGKQYKAVEGDTVRVDRLSATIGEKLSLDKVLLFVQDDDVSVGTPVVEKAKVSATVVKHEKGPKIIVFKYRPRNRYRVKTGHRQQYTDVRIDKINLPG